jgi:Na+/phosphate symporter
MDGLKNAAGDKLRRILIRFMGRPVTAFFSGTAITTRVQSSSATTLATIGFASAGIFTFSQTAGVVVVRGDERLHSSLTGDQHFKQRVFRTWLK